MAQANAQRHGLESRIQFLTGDLLAPLPEPVDLIAANLPYVATHEWRDLAPGIVNYEPTQALLGGADGLDFIRRLLEQAPSYLKPGGVILLEVGASQGSAVGEMARRCFPQRSDRGLDRLRLSRAYRSHPNLRRPDAMVACAASSAQRCSLVF